MNCLILMLLGLSTAASAQMTASGDMTITGQAGAVTITANGAGTGDILFSGAGDISATSGTSTMPTSTRISSAEMTSSATHTIVPTMISARKPIVPTIWIVKACSA